MSSLFLFGNPRLAEEQTSYHDDEKILLLMLPLGTVDSLTNPIPYAESYEDENELEEREDVFHGLYVLVEEG